jgi:signal transduction histidine kinase/DNA-binding response OmpR family regulator/ligand-binding sensor domain-containing protein
MKKYYLLILLIILPIFKITCEPSCHFRHYSTEDGLPQFTINDMLQDRNGFLWFGTWDGISMFDGCKFRNYKVNPWDLFFLNTNRIKKIFDDKYGRIWFKTYDNEINCFNPTTKKFWGLQLEKKTINNSFRVSRIEIKPSGNVWLFSDSDGCVLVKDSLFNTVFFNTENNKIKGTKIFTVLEDSKNGTWLLTNNGLGYLDMKGCNVKFYLSENENNNQKEWQSFFSALDVGSYIFFGSENGRMWKFDKYNGRFTLLSTPLFSSIKKIIKYSNDKLILITENKGFMLYDITKSTFEVYNSNNLPQIKSNEIFETFLLRSRYLWFATNDLGIYRFDLDTKKIYYYSVKTDDASTYTFPPSPIVIEDLAGRTWVQPKGGGFSLYNPITDQLEPFFNNKTSSNWKFSNIIHSAYFDFQGNLWLSTRSNGLEKIVFDNKFFNEQKINTKDNSTGVNEVRAIFEDVDQNLWVSTKDCRLSVYNKYKKNIGKFSVSGKIQTDAILPAVVYCVMQDKEKNIWLGTRGDGVYKLKKKINGKDYFVEHYKKDISDVYSLSENSIYSVLQDSKGRIWIGTYGGGLNLVQTQSDGRIKFVNHRNNLKNFPIDVAYRIRFISENKFGNICIGTTGGMVMFSSHFDVPENIKFKTYVHKPGDNKSLSNNDVHGFCNTKNGEMFIFTFGGGLNKVVAVDKYGFPTQFKSYTITEGLPSDITLAVVEDRFGKLWISTENNLSRFDTQKEVFENFAEIKRMLNGNNNFSEAAVCKLRSNELVFGFTNGIISFLPQPFIYNRFKPYIAFSNLQIFNKSIEIGAEDSPLNIDINSTKELKLLHKQNFINIEYAALDYVDPENILYAYKLDGFDPDWNYVQKQRIANYTNLPKGKYVFRVKSTNSEGILVDNERTLLIEVLPSFWESIWAYILYILFFFGLVYLAVKILYTIYQLRANVSLEKKMSEMKLRFFTDISHEIRTPLTMITAPVEYLMNDKKTPDNIKKQLRIISQNTNRMLRLVNQILDFRKIQFLHLKVQEVEVAPFVDDICDTFSEIADEQKTKFKFVNNAGNEKIWVDPDCLEKILMNLLSNAFKYTPPGKSIQVTIKSDEKYVSVEVQDHGKGVSKEKQKNLFVRFSSFNEDKSKPSTGIGLSMVKELADKHSAKITVESEEGRGSQFTVAFLRGIAHFDKHVEIMVTGDIERPATTSKILLPDDPTENQPAHSTNETKFSVLVVEDDNDLREFIKNIVEEEYLVYEAVDGEDGWEKALMYCPDFIVSDIMMPRMDGIELLQKLKNNINTSHIPVVLLTAKTTIESKLEGLSSGADDYITKPFSVPYFQARIANLIQIRKQLQELFRAEISPQKSLKFSPQPFSITSHDEILMKKVMDYIEENMEMSEFSIDDICQHVNMSRTVFFKKIKSLTGLAPVEFIKDFKMKRAAQILSSGECMIKEVAYLVGISDARYFTRCFKEKYGMTPLEYKNNNLENNVV